MDVGLTTQHASSVSTGTVWPAEVYGGWDAVSCSVHQWQLRSLVS